MARESQAGRRPSTKATAIDDSTETTVRGRVSELAMELCDSLSDTESAEFGAYLSRLRHCANEIAVAVATLDPDSDSIRSFQDEFREDTNTIVKGHRWLTHARTWPEGYAGDYKMLEFVYNDPEDNDFWTRYIRQTTLAVAVRCRIRRLSELLTARARMPGNWLNVACGPCRELLDVPAREDKLGTIYCLDQDENALEYAKSLLRDSPNADNLSFVAGNALRLVNSAATQKKYGPLTTIYSAGLFDYLPSDGLVKLINGLYEALAPSGLLIMPFKDTERYDTFDYHWLFKWHYFLQRTETDFVKIVQDAGIPDDKWTTERDDSGVIIFFLATK